MFLRNRLKVTLFLIHFFIRPNTFVTNCIFEFDALETIESALNKVQFKINIRMKLSTASKSHFRYGCTL